MVVPTRRSTADVTSNVTTATTTTATTTDLSGASVLVIGGLGYLGSRLIPQLVAAGAARVRVLDLIAPTTTTAAAAAAAAAPRSSSNENKNKNKNNDNATAVAGSLSNTEHAGSFSSRHSSAVAVDGAEYVVGSLLDEDVLNEAMQDIDTVIHTASVVDIQPNPQPLVDTVNVTGTRCIVAACQRSSTVERLIYTSSIDVVFSGAPIANGDESLPYAPAPQMTAYIRTKAEAERIVLAANGSTNPNTNTNTNTSYSGGDGSDEEG
eukprot:UC1_evm1s31